MGKERGSPRTGEANVSEVLFAVAERGPERTAVIDGDTQVSYRDLAARAGAFAEAIAAAGARPGDRVGILMRREADAAAAFYGTLAAGAVAVIVNDQLRPRQMEHVLDHSGAKLLFAAGDILDRLPRELDTTAGVIDPGGIDAADPGALPRMGMDPALIVYTSGSTGRPKGVTISHGNLRAGTEAVVSYVRIGADDRIASLLPFTFDYGLNQLLCAVATGATLVIERSPVPARIVRSLAEHEVSVLACVPPLWLQLLATDGFAAPLPSLRAMTNTGGRLPLSAVRKLRQLQPDARLFLMYGLTEAFRSTYLPPEKVDRKPDSIGQAIPGAEVLVIDEHGRECAPGEVGELVHRGPTVALGYWNDPEATGKRYRPHPLRPAGAPDAERVVYSGDLVRRDEDGDLFFVGRDDGMIKTLGYRVSPDEVTEVLHASGHVTEALVAPEHDEIRGSRIVAYIVLSDDGDVDGLKAFCARELARYMQPARFEVVDRLERTPSGKYDARATAGRVR